MLILKGHLKLKKRKHQRTTMWFWWGKASLCFQYCEMSLKIYIMFLGFFCYPFFLSWTIRFSLYGCLFFFLFLFLIGIILFSLLKFVDINFSLILPDLLKNKNTQSLFFFWRSVTQLPAIPFPHNLPSQCVLHREPVLHLLQTDM